MGIVLGVWGMEPHVLGGPVTGVGRDGVLAGQVQPWRQLLEALTKHSVGKSSSSLQGLG